MEEENSNILVTVYLKQGNGDATYTYSNFSFKGAGTTWYLNSDIGGATAYYYETKWYRTEDNSVSNDFNSISKAGCTCTDTATCNTDLNHLCMSDVTNQFLNSQQEACNCNGGSCYADQTCINNTCNWCSPNGCVTSAQICLSSYSASRCADGNSEFSTSYNKCVCKTGFFQYSTDPVACVLTQSNCTSYNSSGCIQCETGYFLDTPNSPKTCSACLSNCQSCSDGNTCTQCLDDYELSPSFTSCNPCSNGQYYDSSTKKCASCISNCDICPNITTCSQCAINFELSSGNQACDPCSTGKYYDSVSKTCKGCIINCKICSEGTECTECISGYNLSEDSQTCTACDNCQACPSNCLTCLVASECSQCFTNYELSLDKASCNECSTGKYYDSASQTCKGCTINCKICSEGTGCTECQSGFALKSNQECNTCESGTYYLSSTDPCQTCMGNCISCSNSDTCDDCDSGFELSDDKRACIECSTGQYYDSATKKCKPCISSCDLCSDASTCSKCATNFILSADSESCSTCSGGKYYNSPSSSCMNCPDKCTQCSSTECTECSIGYILSSDKSSCNLCALGYIQMSDSNLCNPCPDGCISCTSSTICSKCKDSFLLYSSGSSITCRSECPDGYYKYSDLKCEECMAECAKCSALIICEECRPGYYLYSNSTSITCVNECLEGYYLNYSQTSCELCPISNCSSCLAEIDDIRCSWCEDGYYLIDDECQECDEGQYSDGITCSNCPRMCTSCGSNSTCTECEDGYRLNGDSCFQILSFNISYSSGVVQILFDKVLATELTLSDFRVKVNDIELETSEYTLIPSEDNKTYKIRLNTLKRVTKIEILFDQSISGEDDSKLSDLSDSIIIDDSDHDTDNDTDNESDSSTTLSQSEYLAQDSLAEDANSISATASKAAVSGAVLFGITVPSGIWSFISTLQLMSLIPMMNIDIPIFLLGVLSGLRGYSPIPNMIDYMIDREGPKPNNRAVLMGYESSQFLINCGEMISTLSILILILPVLICIRKILSLKKSNSLIYVLINRSILDYKWNVFTRFFVESYIEIGIAAFMQIWIVAEESIYESANLIINLTLCIPVLVIYN